METIEKRVLLASIYRTISGMKDLMFSLDNEEVNTVPYKNSWTAAMLFRHVSKSINAMAGAMRVNGRLAERDADERIPELKKTFLNFSVKMESPGFIAPENGQYQNHFISEELNNSFIRLREATIHASLREIVEGLPQGPITKLEILHFVLYHTQRHLQQMRKMTRALEAKVSV